MALDLSIPAPRTEVDLEQVSMYGLKIIFKFPRKILKFYHLRTQKTNIFSYQKLVYVYVKK